MKTIPSRQIPLSPRWIRPIRPPWWLVASGALVLNLAGAGWITCHGLPSLPAARGVNAPLLTPLPENHAG